MGKGLLDPDSVAWRKENRRRFGSFKAHPGAEPVASDSEQAMADQGRRGWREALIFQLLALAVAVGVIGPFVLFFMLVSE